MLRRTTHGPGARLSSLVMRPFLIGILAGIAAFAQSGTPTGLLIGLRRDFSVRGSAPAPPPSSYRTVWIAPDGEGGKLNHTAVSKVLLIARIDGWWRLGVTRFSLKQPNSAVETDVLWAAPMSEKPWVEGHKPEAEPDCESSSTTRILFAGPSHVSVDRTGTGMCKSTAHPWAYEQVATFPIEALSQPEPKPPARLSATEFSTMFYDAEAAALEKAAPAALARVKQKDLRECLEQTPQPGSWAVVRRPGKWSVRGRLSHGAEVCRGSSIDFDVPVPAPVSMTGSSLEPMFNVKTEIPGALDWAMSPGRNLLAVMLPGKLQIFQVEAGKPAKPEILSVPLEPGESLVGIQWALGRTVERWSKEVASQIAPPAKPAAPARKKQ